MVRRPDEAHTSDRVWATLASSWIRTSQRAGAATCVRGKVNRGPDGDVNVVGMSPA